MSLITEHIQPMRTRKFLAALAVSLLFATSAMATDHLEPVQARDANKARLSSVYNRVIGIAMKDAFAPDVTIRAMILNPLRAEQAVGIRRGRNGAEIFALESSVRLFDYAELDSAKRRSDTQYIAELQSGIPADPAQVKVNRCKYAIGDVMAARIEEVWQQMLRRTRAAETPQGVDNASEVLVVDGTSFDFWKGGLEGTIYSPEAESSASELIALTETMETICRSRDKKLPLKLDMQITELLAHLKPEQPK